MSRGVQPLMVPLLTIQMTVQTETTNYDYTTGLLDYFSECETGNDILAALEELVFFEPQTV